MVFYQHRNFSKFSWICFSADYSPKFLEARTLLAEMLCDLLHLDGKALARQRATDRVCRYMSKSISYIVESAVCPK